MLGGSQIECPWCDEDFGDENRFIVHQSRRHFVCICKARHSSRKELIRHWILTQHCFYCPSCNGGWSDAEIFMNHKCISSRIICPVCKLAAPDLDRYNQHWKVVNKDSRHQDFRPPNKTCQDGRCRKSFKTFELLEAHLRQSHGCQRYCFHFSSENALRMVGWVWKIINTSARH